jgi:hypothetical protein
MPGPAPSWNPARARHRHAHQGPVILPADGYAGELPAWPLAGRQTNDERPLWAALWRTPQASMWAPMGCATARVVARYVRLTVRAELGDIKASAESRMLEDRLGISPASMRRLLWRIGDAPEPPTDGGTPVVTDIRSRIRAVG